jgi:hypothetical protein
MNRFVWGFFVNTSAQREPVLANHRVWFAKTGSLCQKPTGNWGGGGQGAKERNSHLQLGEEIRLEQCRESLRKTVFLSHLYIKTIILPRQARDKHRENEKRSLFPPLSCICPEPVLVNRSFFKKERKRVRQQGRVVKSRRDRFVPHRGAFDEGIMIVIMIIMIMMIMIIIIINVIIMIIMIMIMIMIVIIVMIVIMIIMIIIIIIINVIIIIIMIRSAPWRLRLRWGYSCARAGAAPRAQCWPRKPSPPCSRAKRSRNKTQRDKLRKSNTAGGRAPIDELLADFKRVAPHLRDCEAVKTHLFELSVTFVPILSW